MSIRKILAEYIRLSQEDENEGESNSIINQRDLLNAFVKSSPDLSQYEVVEFCDEYNLRLIQFDTETAVKPHKITALGAKRQTESRYFCFMEI